MNNDPHRPAVGGRPDPWSTWGPSFRLVIAAAAVLLAAWLLVSLLNVVLQVLFAIILATGMAPLVTRLRELGVPRAASVLLTYAVFIAAFVLMGIFVIPSLADEVRRLIANAPQYAEDLARLLRDLQTQFPFIPLPSTPLAEQVQNVLGAAAGQALNVLELVFGALGGVVSLVLVLLLGLYFVVYGGEAREYLLSFVEPARRPRIRSVAENVGQRVGRWVFGQIVLSTVVGVITFVGLTIIGIPGAVILAVIAALGEFIPVLGPILAAIPAITVAFIQSPTDALVTLVFYVVLQQIENYALQPIIVGRAVKLNPMVVLVVLLMGGGLLGIIGALVAVPVAAALAVLLDEFRNGAPDSVAETADAPPGPAPPPETDELTPPEART